jgi:hypothetical protein
MRIARLLLQLVLLAVALLVGTSAAHAQITVQPETQLGRLDQLRGVHPRLFLEAAQVKRLQAGRAGAFSAEWSAMLDSAQEVAAMRPPAYKSDPTQQSEHAWKREHGNQLAILSFAWLLTRERIYLTQASAWARAIASQPVWGIDSKTGKPIETGLVYGHLLLGLSMFYDYAHDDMDAGRGGGTPGNVRQRIAAHQPGAGEAPQVPEIRPGGRRALREFGAVVA